MHNLLSGGDWAYLLGLLVPLCVYDVALKVSRVATQFDVPGPLGFVDQVRSEVFFNLGYAAFWIGVFAAARSGVPRLFVLGLFHAFAIAAVALTTAAHFYHETTGLTLDYGLIAYSLASFAQVRAIIASETTAMHWLLLSAVVLYAVAGPALVARLKSGGWRFPTGTSERPETAPLAVCLAALALGLLSLLPGATGANDSFSRDALANILVTKLSAAAYAAESEEIEADLKTWDLPTGATLAPSPDAERRNVVMVILESTRAKSTTPYADVETTPFFGDLAEESLVAEKAYAVVPHTSKALAATHCGVPPPLDTDTTESDPGAIPARCIPELLEEQGYRTAFFQSATKRFERRRALVENLGYGDFYPVEAMNTRGFEEANYFGFEDDVMLGPSRRWLEENGDGPFLATYLTVTPHHGYVVPDRYGEERFVEDEPLNDYLNALRYQDFFLRNLVRQYKDLGLYDDTIFVVLADHGEGFGEHGLYQHDDTVYEEGLRIPLVIHDPRRFRDSERVEAPVNQLDVLPTLADLLGYEIDGGTYPGASMLSPPRDRVLMAGCFHEHRCLASIRGDEKYIHYYGNQPDERFDLSKDPAERRNVAEEHEKEIESRRDELLAWEAKVRAAYERRLPKAEE